MTKTRALAWIMSAAAFGAILGLAAPASAQGYYGQQHGYSRGEVYGAPPTYRHYEVAPPLRHRARPVDPYYGNAPTARKYGHGFKRHWRRWTRDSHPGWRDQSGYYNQGWARPRYFDYR